MTVSAILGDGNKPRRSMCVQQSIFGVKDNGFIKYHKRFDFQPACFVLYELDRLIACSFTRHMMVYKDNKLL